MEHRHLGRSGLKVSGIALGTMNFGMTAEKSAAFEIVDAACSAGRRVVSTSPRSPSTGMAGPAPPSRCSSLDRVARDVSSFVEGLEFGADQTPTGPRQRHRVLTAGHVDVDVCARAGRLPASVIAYDTAGNVRPLMAITNPDRCCSGSTDS